MNRSTDPDAAAFARVWQRVMPQPPADCPIVLNDPPAPLPAIPVAPPVPQPPSPTLSAVCLGESSRNALPTLEELTLQVSRGRQTYAALARRVRGQREREQRLRAFAADREHWLRRLRTAYFLISGREPPAPSGRTEPIGPLNTALRDRYHAEQSLAHLCLTAVSQTSDPCLTDLYRTLAQDSRALSGRLRELLEEE